LARDEDGTIIDYFNGLDDLTDKILRTPLPTETTFNDDPLRILRGIRFSITKGFTIPGTMAITMMVYNYDEKMSVVSTERIREELFKCFKYDTLETLRVLDEFPLLKTYIFKDKGLWLKPTMEQ
jgi:tRNA nucleotidyltransferase/poly(A) polymerase